MSISAPSVCLLSPLGVMGIRGPAARSFLQGQLSNDLGLLAAPARAGDAPAALLRAGLHTAQGRTLALLGLVSETEESLLAVLPRELVATTLATLRRYVLRARVSLSDESDAWRLYGMTSPPPSGGETALEGDAHDSLRVVWAPGRSLVLARTERASAPAGLPLSYDGWHALDIAAGLPQVYAASSALFVAQMLNLDCIEAISFTKGCYTGQEVIARAHYRGRVKRRMQRYRCHAPLQLGPGDRGELSDGSAFVVVDSELRADGPYEFLAVSALVPGSAQSGEAAGPDSAAPAGSAQERAEPRARVDAQRLALPYALPE